MLALVAVLAVSTGAALAAPASTATIYYGSASISGARVPATTVTLTVATPGPLRSVTFSVNGRVVGQGSTSLPSGTSYRTSAQVDLTALSGATVLRTRTVSSTGTSATVDKSFTAVAPVKTTTPSAPQTTAPASPASTAPAAVTAAPTTTAPPVQAAESAPVPTSPPAIPTTTAESAVTTPAGPTTTTPAPAPVAPGPDNTGVPAGVALTPRTGNVVLATAGAVLENVDLTGCINVMASNVVIRNVRVSCASAPAQAAIRVFSGFGGLVVEDSEIDGLGTTEIGVGFSGFTLRRVEIRNTNDGVRMASNSTVEASWIHGMTRQGTLHPDAIQSTGGVNIVIRGNTLDPTGAAGDLNNGAIQLGSETSGQLTNVLIEGNRLGGGNFSLNVRGDTVATNVVLRGNVFTGGWRYGPAQAPPSVSIDATNVVEATGLPIVVKAP